MKKFLTGALVSLLFAPLLALAQAAESVEPFKVGTFAVGTDKFVGLVVRDDSLIVDVQEANRAMELDSRFAQIAVPGDMVGFIEQYEYGLKYRVYEVMNWLVAQGQLVGSNRPGYVH
ncbi:MAG: hypothetical protein RL120_19025, partial [Gammaproteobacteria bacterium]